MGKTRKNRGFNGKHGGILQWGNLLEMELLMGTSSINDGLSIAMSTRS